MGGSPEPREFKAAVSPDHATVLQPGQQSETLSEKEKERKEGGDEGGGIERREERENRRGREG